VRRGPAGDPEALDRARTTARVIVASPALQARERQVLMGIAAELADAIGPVAAEPVPVPVVVQYVYAVEATASDATTPRTTM